MLQMCFIERIGPRKTRSARPAMQIVRNVCTLVVVTGKARRDDRASHKTHGDYLTIGSSAPTDKDHRPMASPGSIALGLADPVWKAARRSNEFRRQNQYS